MNTSALVIMLTVQLFIVVMTVYLFTRMLKAKPDKDTTVSQINITEYKGKKICSGCLDQLKGV